MILHHGLPLLAGFLIGQPSLWRIGVVL